MSQPTLLLPGHPWLACPGANKDGPKSMARRVSVRTAGREGGAEPILEVTMALPLLLSAPQGCVAPGDPSLPPAGQAPLSRAPRAVAGKHSEDRSAGR